MSAADLRRNTADWRGLVHARHESVESYLHSRRTIRPQHADPGSASDRAVQPGARTGSPPCARPASSTSRATCRRWRVTCGRWSVPATNCGSSRRSTSFRTPPTSRPLRCWSSEPNATTRSRSTRRTHEDNSWVAFSQKGSSCLSSCPSCLRVAFTRPGRGDELLEQRPELAGAPEVLRMPLHREAEPARRAARWLRSRRRVRCPDLPARRDSLHRLMMPAVDLAGLAFELVAHDASRAASPRPPRPRARCAKRGSGTAWCAAPFTIDGMSWTSVPPSATFSTCMPRQIAKIGRPASIAALMSAIS